MDAAVIQSKIYTGFAKAASYVGSSFSQYRPVAGQPPIGPATLVGSINAAFTVATGDTFTFGRPGLKANFFYYCLADGAQIQVGDILT